MHWLKQALTGPDNETMAIGRLIGMAIAIVLMIGLPVSAAGTVVLKLASVDTWATLFTALQLYVPAVALSIGGLIFGTNPTEPKPRDPPAKDADQ